MIELREGAARWCLRNGAIGGRGTRGGGIGGGGIGGEYIGGGWYRYWKWRVMEVEVSGGKLCGLCLNSGRRLFLLDCTGRVGI